MKARELLILLFLCCSFIPAFGNSRIITKGKWGGGSVRTIIPAPPEVYINGNILSITCENILLDLHVTIKEKNGIVIYKGTICIESQNHIDELILPNNPGSYEILLFHQHGELFGFFEIE